MTAAETKRKDASHVSSDLVGEDGKLHVRGYSPAMQWIARSEKDTANNELEKRLWQAADQLRANSGLMIYIYDEKGRQTGSTPAR